ncbi:NUDIX hydrolase [Providencia vermicola]|uniref:NUDIX domain-containing protein n=1 Tax=Providencia stuartii TaxID=588 RepID=A0AAI9HWV0_PROST|nr:MULTISPECIES: NUDIX domain-containing protein [Providencia]ELR5034008.1 NUDIX domain-containing protein [Providencia stuartii]ELR5119626.1 NUDIX domain-containing protein [Providencia stuartii]MTB39020.1 NUDIX domain-containing protein [Providencia sp. wls1949]MTC09838.1 NUDIX domain-containing protein [Providencia sp. wls1948]WBA58705.1 NUDIX domain-containing protein [Providencia sp. 21OH12SH02B-Prov]
MSIVDGVVVGVGVIITNQQGQILMGKRSSQHAPYWSIFGGHVDAGESFEACAIREIKEEIGIDITTPTVFGISNNVNTYQQEGKHTVSICMHVEYNGDIEPQIMEADKCESLMWVAPNELPEPHFEASRNAIDLWLNQQFYHHPA